MTESKITKKLREEAFTRAKNYTYKESQYLNNIVDRLYKLEPERSNDERESIVRKLHKFHIVMTDLVELKLLEVSDEQFLQVMKATLESAADSLDKDEYHAPALPERVLKEIVILMETLDDVRRSSIELAVERLSQTTTSGHSDSFLTETDRDNLKAGILHTIVRADISSLGKSTQVLLKTSDEQLMDEYVACVEGVKDFKVVNLSGDEQAGKTHVAILQFSPEKREDIDKRFAKLPHQENAKQFVVKAVEELAKKAPTDDRLKVALFYSAKLAVLGFDLFNQHIDLSGFDEIPEKHHFDYICELLKQGLQFAKNLNLEGE